MSVVTKEFQFGNQKVTLETGKIARQASGAVMVNMGDTVVLVTCVAKKEAKESRYWLKLSDPSSNVTREKDYLFNEATELMKILGAIIERSK